MNKIHNTVLDFTHSHIRKYLDTETAVRESCEMEMQDKESVRFKSFYRKEIVMASTMDSINYLQSNIALKKKEGTINIRVPSYNHLPLESLITNWERLVSENSNDSEEKMVNKPLIKPIRDNSKNDINNNSNPIINSITIWYSLFHESVNYNINGNVKSIPIKNALLSYIYNKMSLTREDSDEENRIIERLGLSLSDKENIKKLSLCVEDLTSISFLSKFDNITILEMNVNRIKSLRGIETLVKLEVLTVNDNMLTSVEELQYLLNLKHVKLDSNKLTNIDVVMALPSIISVSANQNYLESFPNIDSNTLVHLELQRNRILDVSQLRTSRIPHLLLLDLNSNCIEFISGDWLTKFQLLQTLILSHNHLSIAPSPIFLPNLTILWLSGNRLTNLSVWVPPSSQFHLEDILLQSVCRDEITFKCKETSSSVFLPCLVSLHLQDNMINHIDLNSLSAMPSLKLLDLSFNRLTCKYDLGGLVMGSNKNLETLLIHDNAIYQSSIPVVNSTNNYNPNEKSIGSNKFVKWIRMFCPQLTRLSDFKFEPSFVDISELFLLLEKDFPNYFEEIYRIKVNPFSFIFNKRMQSPSISYNWILCVLFGCEILSKIDDGHDAANTQKVLNFIIDVLLSLQNSSLDAIRLLSRIETVSNHLLSKNSLKYPHLDEYLDKKYEIQLSSTLETLQTFCNWYSSSISNGDTQQEDIAKTMEHWNKQTNKACLKALDFKECFLQLSKSVKHLQMIFRSKIARKRLKNLLKSVPYTDEELDDPAFTMNEFDDFLSTLNPSSIIEKDENLSCKMPSLPLVYGDHKRIRKLSGSFCPEDTVKLSLFQSNILDGTNYINRRPLSSRSDATSLIELSNSLQDYNFQLIENRESSQIDSEQKSQSTIAKEWNTQNQTLIDTLMRRKKKLM
jgi:Leucine-rich repeat (LRR) protein